MEKISESVRVQFIARDKETNFLRFESRAMTLAEASEFITTTVQQQPENVWSMEVYDASSENYGFYVRDLKSNEVIYNQYNFDSTSEITEEPAYQKYSKKKNMEITIYQYEDKDDPQVENVISVTKTGK